MYISYIRNGFNNFVYVLWEEPVSMKQFEQSWLIPGTWEED